MWKRQQYDISLHPDQEAGPKEKSFAMHTDSENVFLQLNKLTASVNNTIS
jgi:hypothetical protein